MVANLVHRLYRTQSLAKQPVEFFKSLVSQDDFRAAEAKQSNPKTKTWFSLTTAALASILYQVYSFSYSFYGFIPTFVFLYISALIIY